MSEKSTAAVSKRNIVNKQIFREMLSYVKEKYSTNSFKIEYLITRRLNQDVIENLFSYIRRMGGTNDHPSLVEWQYRLKSYSLGKNTEDSLSRNKITESDTSSVDFINVEDVNSSNLQCNAENTLEEDLAEEEQLFLPTKPFSRLRSH